MVGAGPYVGYGLRGVVKSLEEDAAVLNQLLVIFTNKIEFDPFYSNNIFLKPWDYGINAMVGYEFPTGIIVGIHGQLGLVNFIHPFQFYKNNSSSDKSSIKNIGLNLSLGYKF